MKKLPPLHYEGLSFPGGVTIESGIAHAQGRGRHWRTEVPLGFWRDFSEIEAASGSPPSPADAEPFLARYGSLDRELPDHPASLFHWHNLIGHLRFVAKAWDPVDSQGLSWPVPHRLKVARTFLDRYAVPVELKGGFTIVVKDLGNFMLLSASSMVRAEVPMRRCVECGSWLAATHERTRYCSNACSVRAAQRKKGLR